jgi:hypothetical protein
MAGAAADFARHLIGDAGRKPVVNIPPDPAKLEFSSVPLAMADDLFRGENSDQRKRQQAAQFGALKTPHGFRETP